MRDSMGSLLCLGRHSYLYESPRYGVEELRLKVSFTHLELTSGNKDEARCHKRWVVAGKENEKLVSKSSAFRGNDESSVPRTFPTIFSRSNP